jgi:hypothetical protein
VHAVASAQAQATTGTRLHAAQKTGVGPGAVWAGIVVG